MANAVRLMWTFMTLLCCLWAFIASLAGDATGALTIGGAGVAFWFMSGLSYGDLPDE